MKLSRLRKAQGFTLVELMIVVVIIAVLAAIAVPGYQRYIRAARTSEAFSNTGAMSAYQETYFSENDQYVCGGENPAVLPQGGTRQSWNSAQAGWTDLGRVMPNNRQLYFQYEMTAGSVDGTGTFVVNTGCESGSTGATITHHADVGTCTAIGDNANFTGISPAALGISNTANTFWYVITAMGDQDNDTLCSLFIHRVDIPEPTVEQKIE